MCQTASVAAALLVATLLSATATAVHVNAQASVAEAARADLQRRATELHLMALRNTSGDRAIQVVEAEFSKNLKVHAE